MSRERIDRCFQPFTVLSAAALAIAASVVFADQPDDPRHALEHGTRAEQTAALVALEAKSELSADWAAPLFDFVNAEIDRLALPLDSAAAADRIPFLGDEISLAQLQAAPERYREHKGPLVGLVRVSSAYRGAAKDLAKSHFALEVTPLDEQGKRLGPARACAYVPRSFGGLLLERLTSSPAGRREAALVRLEVLLLEPSPQNAPLLIATDWQLLCDGAWTEWEFAGLRSAFRVVPKLGRAAVPGLVNLLSRKAVPARPALTETVRTMCRGTLLKMDARERRQAAALIDHALAKKQGAARAALLETRIMLRESLER
jgi:hypothetical protein